MIRQCNYRVGRCTIGQDACVDYMMVRCSVSQLRCMCVDYAVEFSNRIDRSGGWLPSALFGWLVGWLVSWLVGWQLAGWLVDSLVSCLEDNTCQYMTVPVRSCVHTHSSQLNPLQAVHCTVCLIPYSDGKAALGCRALQPIFLGAKPPPWGKAPSNVDTVLSVYSP